MGGTECGRESHPIPTPALPLKGRECAYAIKLAPIPLVGEGAHSFPHFTASLLPSFTHSPFTLHRLRAPVRVILGDTA